MPLEAGLLALEDIGSQRLRESVEVVKGVEVDLLAHGVCRLVSQGQ